MGPQVSSIVSRAKTPGWQLDYRLEMRDSAILRARFLRGAWKGTPMDMALASLIEAAEKGDGTATEALFSTLYSELHRMAKRELARRGGGVSLSVTTLLHEAYLDMAGSGGPSFPDKARFMGYAARVMRGLIIDHARERHAQKRGGLFEITSLDTETMEHAVDHRELAQIGGALDKLGKMEPALAEIVDLKFFCGFTFAEIAAMRDVSERTVQRDWEKARIYLHSKLRANLSL